MAPGKKSARKSAKKPRQSKGNQTPESSSLKIESPPASSSSGAKCLIWTKFLEEHRNSLMRTIGQFNSLSTQGRILLQCLFKAIKVAFWGDNKPLIDVLSAENIVVRFYQSDEGYSIIDVTLRRLKQRLYDIEEESVRAEDALVTELDLMLARLGDLTRCAAEYRLLDPCLVHIKGLLNINTPLPQHIPAGLHDNLDFRWQVVLNHPCTWGPKRSSVFITKLYSACVGTRHPQNAQNVPGLTDFQGPVANLIRDYHVGIQAMNTELIADYLSAFFMGREKVQKFYVDCCIGLDQFYAHRKVAFGNERASVRYLILMRRLLMHRDFLADHKNEFGVFTHSTVKDIPIPSHGGYTQDPDKGLQIIMDQIYEFGGELICNWLMTVWARQELNYLWKHSH